MRVLVTGFEPFGGGSLNPSAEIARNLPRSVAGAAVRAAVLPVVYHASLRMLRRLVALERPDAVIALGLAGGRSRLSFEVRAENRNDARIPDNDGQQPREEEIRRGGPRYLPPTLPLRYIRAALRAKGLPFEYGPGPGTFLCNHVFYGLVDHAHSEDPSLRAGFVHVPFLPEQVAPGSATPTLDLETMVRGIREAIRVLAG